MSSRLRRNKPTSGSSAYAFNAFISYSHAADGGLALALQHALERFAKPWYRLRALRVFRDDANLAVTAELWEDIREALDGSEFLIVLASPTGAVRDWVIREAAYWGEHKDKRIENVLIGLTDGSDADWQNTALPSPLRGVFAEPRFVDLRWTRVEAHLSLQDHRFRDNVADIAAKLHHVDKDRIAGEHVRQHRRTIRLARSAAGSLALLALVATSAAVVAWDKRNEARAQRDRAVHESHVASALGLAGQALGNLGRSPDRALLLSLEAYRAQPMFQARNVIVSAMEHSAAELGTLPSRGGYVIDVGWMPDGRHVLTGAQDGAIESWDIETHRPVRTLLQPGGHHRDWVSSLDVSRDGRYVAVAGRKGISLLRLGRDDVSSVVLGLA